MKINQYMDIEFIEKYKKLKSIILKMREEIDELETKCELIPLYKVIDIGEIEIEKFPIMEKYVEIYNSIERLKKTIEDYKLKQKVLKSKFKNKKSNDKSGQKSKSVKVQKLETIKKVKSINKLKKKSKTKRGL